MSLQDPIADFLTRVRNAQMAKHTKVRAQASTQKENIAKVLKEAGYIEDYSISTSEKPEIEVTLKYHEGKPVIDKVERVSKPGLRVYKDKDNLPLVKNGLGTAIISTNKGLLTDKQARAAKVGGEVLCILE